jgi:hypothetical protein
MLDYLAGDLPAGTHEQFEFHLNECINCRRYLKNYVETVKLGKRAFDDEDGALPADLPEELVQAIVAAVRNSRP